MRSTGRLRWPAGEGCWLLRDVDAQQVIYCMEWMTDDGVERRGYKVTCIWWRELEYEKRDRQCIFAPGGAMTSKCARRRQQ